MTEKECVKCGNDFRDYDGNDLCPKCSEEEANDN